MTFTQALSQNALFQAMGRVLLACGACAVIVSVASVILLALTLTLSSEERMGAHLREAADKGLLTREVFPLSPYGHTNHAYDMGTECVAFVLSLSNSGEGLLRRIASSATWSRERVCDRLIDGVSKGGMVADDIYPRYWHGYQAYIRPLLSVLSLENFRRVTAVLLYGALVFFAWQLARWFGPLSWPVVFLPLFVIGDFLTLPVVTSHAISLIFIFLSVALVPVILDRYQNAHELILPVYVFAAGMVTSFVSFLTNPPLAPALIGFLVIAHRSGCDLRRTLETALYAGGLVVLWFAGYFAEWVAKWVFAAIVLGWDVIINDLKGTAANYHAEFPPGGPRLLEATKLNMYQYEGHLRSFTFLAFGAAAAMLAWLAFMRRLSLEGLVSFLAMLAPLAVIVVWVETNPEHSVIHTGFVSRSFLLFIIIPLLAALLVWGRAVPASARSLARPEPV